MRELVDTICADLAQPESINLRERLLQAMFMMELSRGIDDGSLDTVSPSVRNADVSAPNIARLANALRIFIVSHSKHPDVGTAIWALGTLREEEDAQLFEDVLCPESSYDSHAREQARCSLEVIRH